MGRDSITQPFPWGRSPRERRESPSSEAGTRSLAATPPVWPPSPEKQDTLTHQLRPIEHRGEPDEAPARPEHRVSSAWQVAHTSMLSQGPSLPCDIPCPPCHHACAITHLTLVHRPLLGADRAVASLAPGGVPILGRGPPLWAAVAALHLRLAELQAELLVLLLHPAHPRGQRLPLHIPARLLAQAGRQQEEAAICREDMGHAMGTARQSSARRDWMWMVGQSPK